MTPAVPVWCLVSLATGFCEDVSEEVRCKQRAAELGPRFFCVRVVVPVIEAPCYRFSDAGLPPNSGSPLAPEPPNPGAVPIPEPGTLAALLAGIVGLACVRKI